MSLSPLLFGRDQTSMIETKLRRRQSAQAMSLQRGRAVLQARCQEIRRLLAFLGTRQAGQHTQI